MNLCTFRDSNEMDMKCIKGVPIIFLAILYI